MANKQFKSYLVKSITESLLNEAEEVTTDQIVDLIKNTKGTFFTVVFIKKDGTERTMNARFGVKKYLRGGELPYDPIQKGLLPVWDPQAMDKGGDGYRMINIGTIKSAKIGGVEYIVKPISESGLSPYSPYSRFKTLGKRTLETDVKDFVQTVKDNNNERSRMGTPEYADKAPKVQFFLEEYPEYEGKEKEIEALIKKYYKTNENFVGNQDYTDKAEPYQDLYDKGNR
jgi:hypothetical protein